MNRRIVFLLLALIGAIVAGTMFAASLIAAVCHWPDVLLLLKWSLGALGVCGAIAMAAFKKRRKNDPPEHITGRAQRCHAPRSKLVRSCLDNQTVDLPCNK